MPPTTKSNHPSCSLSITFTEADHRYVDNENTEYTSVTTVIKGAFAPFNAREAAARVAKREGGTVDEVLKSWDDKRNAAADFGTRFHANMEATFKKQARPNPPRTEKEMQVMKVGAETAKKLIARYGDGIEAEKIVFSPFYRIAGCIDLLAIKGSDAIIFDWKTNEAIKRENKFQSCAIQGLDHLQECDFVRYALQLSMYQRILTRHGYMPCVSSIKRILIHIPPEAEKPEFIELPDMNREVAEIILEHSMMKRFEG